MRRLNLIVDCGSHSLKLYKRDDQIEQLGVTTWELLESDHSADVILHHFHLLLDPWLQTNAETDVSIRAIGTEAMRRHPELADQIQSVCKSLGIVYTTISQIEEASLLRKAATQWEIPEDLDLINAGGGSIQILLGAEEKPFLLPFGISDLNARFDLSAAPEIRRIEECIDWIVEQLPQSLVRFAYTGGERAYLKHFGISLPNGFCSADDFMNLSNRLGALSMEELEACSPFDAKWMRGAVASNCIVLAALKRSGAETFLPTDVNIAHGVLAQV